MPRLQPEQGAEAFPVSVVIRKSGYAWTWICKVPVTRKGKKEPCNHTEVVSNKDEAGPAYEKHKKTARGH